MGLHGGYLTKQDSARPVAFLVRVLSHLRIHFGGLKILPVDGSLKIGGGVAYPVQSLEVVFGVAPLVIGCLFKNLGDVVIPLFPRNLGEKGILVAGL